MSLSERSPPSSTVARPSGPSPRVDKGPSGAADYERSAKRGKARPKEALMALKWG